MKTVKTNIVAGALAVALAACSSTQFQKLERNVFYKRDLAIRVNGQSYDGVVAIPKASSYRIELNSPGDIDMILWRSCAREDSGTPKRPGFFLFKGKKKVSYNYKPLPGLEDTGTCPLRVDSFDSKHNQHAWAFLIFERPKEFNIPYKVDCNGRRIQFNGVGACQHKAGLVARIQFFEPVMFSSPKPSSCPIPKRVGKYLYKWEMGVGECLYHFKNRDGHLGKLLGIGYQGVLVRGGV